MPTAEHTDGGNTICAIAFSRPAAVTQKTSLKENGNSIAKVKGHRKLVNSKMGNERDLGRGTKKSRKLYDGGKFLDGRKVGTWSITVQRNN